MSAFCDVGFAIRAVRSARQMSQPQLAKRARTTRQRINAIECRRNVPTLQSLQHICKALELPLTDLITIATAKDETI